MGKHDKKKDDRDELKWFIAAQFGSIVTGVISGLIIYYLTK